MDKTLGWIITLVVAPLVLIWSVSTLFQIVIPLTFVNWLAAMALVLIVSV